MSESEFIELIDCRFPYHVESEWRRVVALGASISPNAAFMVLHELCRLPSGEVVAPGTMNAMLEFWREHFSHPLAAELLRVARTMIEGKTISVEEAMRVMRDIATFRDQYVALSIVYFACDDTEGKADALHQKIINMWRSPVTHH